jgi:sterol desaturase/sphingolipid hydroxylase (fatty acid hydroxylase superfamily)
MVHGMLGLLTNKLLIILLLLFATRRAERWIPADPVLPTADVSVEYKLIALRLLFGVSAAPYCQAASVALVNALGGGIVVLPSGSWWFPFSVLTYLVIFDLQQYAIHRLAHRSAFFWSMHSLHHSARVVTVTSSTRHFWLEEVAGVAIGLPIGLALRVPVEILIVAAPLRSIIIALAHTNVRASYGPISLLITGPQYHRIHHSNRPEHIDKNFAELFPLWDVIFGTAWRPKPHEFPTTGLMSGEVPAGFVDLLVWPVRHRFARSQTMIETINAGSERHEQPTETAFAQRQIPRRQT